MKPANFVLPVLTAITLLTSCGNSMSNQTNIFSEKRVGAWFFPGFGKLEQTFKTTGRIETLNPQWGGISQKGELVINTDPYDGYSKKNTEIVKSNSSNHYINIVNLSGLSSMRSLLESPVKEDKFISDSIKWVKNNDFTGLEVDFELFWEWNSRDKTRYIQFLKKFTANAHANGIKIIADLPALAGSDVEQNIPSGFTYKEIDQIGLDGVTIMAYDAMYGQKPPFPIQPLSWAKRVSQYASSQFLKTPVTIGIPAYGYRTKADQPITKPETFTFEEAQKMKGIKAAQYDKDSGELQWETDGYFYSVNDMTSIRQKIQAFPGQKIMIWQVVGSPMVTPVGS
jgi:peptidoglycan-N-acetylglucosamine deacetylase